MIFYLFFLVSVVLTGDVYVTYYKGQGCEVDKWVDSFKLGETTIDCKKTKILEDDYYYTSSCDEDKEEYVVSFFFDEECSNFLYNETITYYPDCSGDPQLLDYSMQGSCNYILPSTYYSHVRLFPQILTNTSICNGTRQIYIDVVIRPGMCVEIPGAAGWGVAKSSQLFCDGHGMINMFYYSDKSCKNVISKVNVKADECTGIPDVPLAVMVSDCNVS